MSELKPNSSIVSRLQSLDQEAGYLKAGFMGFSKSGKTFTSSLLLCAAYKRFGGKGPIAFYDTEGGSQYVAKMIKDLTGSAPVGIRSRAFSDLIGLAKECESEGIKYLLVDSVTHPWRELCETALKEINKARAGKNLRPLAKLEFQHWGLIKDRWNEWTNWYLNSPVHTVICGRAGFEYDFVEDDNGRKQLEKTGIKMKTEGEFGFEPSLLVYMERDSEGVDNPKIVRTATVLGDRFNLLDGATFTFPAEKDSTKALARVDRAFSPHLDLLKPNSVVPTIDTDKNTILGFDAFGNDDTKRWAAKKDGLIEAIKTELMRAFPTQNDANKVKRLDLAREVFPNANGFSDIEAVNNLEDLEDGLEKLKIRVAEIKGE